MRKTTCGVIRCFRKWRELTNGSVTSKDIIINDVADDDADADI